MDGSYTTEYGYDGYNRLQYTSAGNNSRYYTYDPWGNLLRTDGLIGGSVQPLYTINIAMTGGYGGGAPLTNRILNVQENGQTLAHTYDAAGNLTNDGQKSYSYDAAGRMTSVNGGALGTYGYSGDGKRVRKVEGGATTYYVNSSVLGSALFELNGTGAVNRVHVTAGGKEIAQQATDGGFYWLHTDHLGTPRRMTNSNGTVMFRGEYDPHGNPLLEWTTISNGKFTGYERDAAAGLDFAQARHYKFGRGRFMQPDPSGIQPDRKIEPQSLNRYRYASNDPVNKVDGTGLADQWWVVGDFTVCIGYCSGSGLGIGTSEPPKDNGRRNANKENELEQAELARQILRLTQALEIAQGLNDAVTALNINGPCASFFGGSEFAASVLEQLGKVTRALPTPDSRTAVIGQIDYGPTRSASDGMHIYRTPALVAVNTLNGGWYFNGNGATVGPYDANSRRGRALAWLHEIAHDIGTKGPNGEDVWLIPTDGAASGQSNTNTDTVLAACQSELENQIP